MYPEIFLFFYFFEISFFRSPRSISHLFLYIYFQFLNFWVTLLFSICNFWFNYLQFQPELCFMASFNWCALLCLRVFIIFRVSLYRFWAFFFFCWVSLFFVIFVLDFSAPSISGYFSDYGGGFLDVWLQGLLLLLTTTKKASPFCLFQIHDTSFFGLTSSNLLLTSCLSRVTFFSWSFLSFHRPGHPRTFHHQRCLSSPEALTSQDRHLWCHAFSKPFTCVSRIASVSHWMRPWHLPFLKLNSS